MHYLLTIVLILLYNIATANEYDFNLYTEQVAYERKQQEKLFNISHSEKVEMETSTAFMDIGGIDNFPYYPIIRLDFFNIFNPSYYKDKKFTYTIDNVSFRDRTVLGIRVRMSVGSTR